MNALDAIFENSFKKYKGEDAHLFSMDTMVSLLEERLPRDMGHWLEQESFLAPIAKVAVEIDQSGYVYASLFNEKGGCMLSEGYSPDLDDLGLRDVYDKSPALVTQFLAICYQKALPKVCETPDFLHLPRAAHIVFSLGEHAGWVWEEVYVFIGERFEINHGNVLLKRLAEATTCFTEPDTVERAFMDHLQNMDIQKCVNELLPVFQMFFEWLSAQRPTPVEAIVLAWSSHFDQAPALGAYCENDVLHRLTLSNDLYKWFSENRPPNLDEEERVNIRYCVSNKLAEMACLVMEKASDLESFKAIPKQKGFVMEVVNRTAGAPPVFYREHYSEEDTLT